jgi:outer membrane protein assembly factor BamE (lipoprotein component of BamABCDE complex)
MKFSLIIAALLSVLMAGCMSASQHRQAVQDDTGERVTVGTVQKEIHVGMSGAEVASVLGSPNIVSTDEERREVWIYDKVATDYAYSSSSGGISALILGWGGAVAGGAAPGYSASSGAASQSQRTLTIIIKFDKQGKVRDFAYHSSKF